MFWLLVIGLIHAYLIWYGDILTAYALIGMVAVFIAPLVTASVGDRRSRAARRATGFVRI